MRVGRRIEARERKVTVRQARQAAIQRRAEELTAKRLAAEDNSALDALIGEVQDKLYQKRGSIARGFLDLFDRNRDGTVDRREITDAIEELLIRKVPAEQIDAVLAKLDTDGDGDIDLNEFVAVMKIDDKQTRDIIRNPKAEAAAAAAAAAAAGGRRTPVDNSSRSGGPAVQRANQDWLTKRQQELGDAGGISQITRRNMLAGADVRAIITPPGGPGTVRAAKAIGLSEIQAAEAAKIRQAEQAEIDRIEKGGEHERALREIAALQKVRWEARVRTARANRQADSERAASNTEKQDRYDLQRVAAKRFQREEWEGAARLRDFYACGFHGAQQVEPDAHPSHIRQPASSNVFGGPRRSEQNPFWSARADKAAPSTYVGVIGGRPPTPAQPVTYAWA